MIDPDDQVLIDFLLEKIGDPRGRDFEVSERPKNFGVYGGDYLWYSDNGEWFIFFLPSSRAGWRWQFKAGDTSIASISSPRVLTEYPGFLRVVDHLAGT